MSSVTSSVTGKDERRRFKCNFLVFLYFLCMYVYAVPELPAAGQGLKISKWPAVKRLQHKF